MTTEITKKIEELTLEEKIPSPPRPGAVSGPKIQLRTNYVKISKFPNLKLYQYGYEIVSSSNKKPGKKVRGRVFTELGKKNKFGRCFPVYDGNDLIYCSAKLNLKNGDSDQFNMITLPPEPPEVEGSSKKVVTFNVTIRFKKEFSLQHLKDYITSKQGWDGNVQTCMHALNAYINYKVRLDFLSVGRGIYPPSNEGRIMLSGGAELKKGFCQSLRAGWDDLIVNVDVCSNMFCPPGNVVDIAANILQLRNGVNDLRRGLDDRSRRTLSKALKGMKFRVTHRGNNKKSIYTIEDFTKESASKITFKNDKNRDVTITQFFADRYSKKLEFGNLPCVMVSKASKNYFPLELCEILPDQPFRGDISDEGRADMIKYTCVKPADRFRTIEGSFRNVFRYDQDEYLKSINMDVNTNMMTVTGTILPPVSMTFRGQTQKIDTGRWNFVNQKIQDGKKLTNWSVLVLSNDPVEAVRRFIQQLREALNNRGMNVVNTPPIMTFNGQGNIQQGLAQAAQKAIFDKSEPPQLIMVLMRDRSRLYSDIKRISETILGVRTQCLLSKHLRKQKGVDQLLVNLGLKINGKLGGKNCSLSPGQIDFISTVPTMVFGADVFHSGAHEQNHPSIAAVCASMDPTATIYSGRYSMNVTPRNETIENLHDMVIDLLKTFRAKNGRLPQRIIFYRDGVSEGQFRKVKEDEVAAMQKAFKGGYGDKPPKLTFIIVQKRHHTRFMPTSPRDGDRLGNCKPGTVVDTGIVVKQEFDFFLQSHASIQGTGRPTHYRVLLDENKFKSDEMVSLTNKLCYLNARCSSAISLVTPAYYAHLIANRARHYTVWDDSTTSSEGNASCAKVKQGMSNAMFFL